MPSTPCGSEVIHIADSKTVNGIGDMPMTPPAREAFARQMAEAEGSEYLFPTPKLKAKKPHMTNLRKVWANTLKRAGVPYFAIYELRHTFATRLSAGGVADHMVTQMLRQGDADVFKLYSQAKLGMMREALAKLDRQANEQEAILARSSRTRPVYSRFVHGRRFWARRGK
jgi:integrase